FSNQSNASQLDNEDLEQIDTNDLEEMDLKCQVAMLTIRVKRFIKKIGRKIDLNGKESVRFDRTKVECYNCHRRGHFARECKAPRNQGNRNRDAPISNAPVGTSTTNALVVQDGIEESCGVNLAWIIADHLYNHASGTKESSGICAGHYITKIASSLGYCVDDEIKKCSEPIDCEYWTMKMLAGELDEKNHNQGGSYGLGDDDYFPSAMLDFGGNSLRYAVGGSSRGAGFDDEDMDNKTNNFGHIHVVWIDPKEKELIGRRETRKREGRIARRGLCRSVGKIAARMGARHDCRPAKGVRQDEFGRRSTTLWRYVDCTRRFEALGKLYHQIPSNLL
nr:hypothetical protein [Tanacetum cinerariifolium]